MKPHKHTHARTEEASGTQAEHRTPPLRPLTRRRPRPRPPGYLWMISLGGFGFGLLYDLFNLSSYVEIANMTPAVRALHEKYAAAKRRNCRLRPRRGSLASVCGCLHDGSARPLTDTTLRRPRVARLCSLHLCALYRLGAARHVSAPGGHLGCSKAARGAFRVWMQRGPVCFPSLLLAPIPASSLNCSSWRNTKGWIRALSGNQRGDQRARDGSHRLPPRRAGLSKGQPLAGLCRVRLPRRNSALTPCALANRARAGLRCFLPASESSGPWPARAGRRTRVRARRRDQACCRPLLLWP